MVDYPISNLMVSSSYPPGLCFFLGTPRSACSYGSERQTRFEFQIIYFLGFLFFFLDYSQATNKPSSKIHRNLEEN